MGQPAARDRAELLARLGLRRLRPDLLEEALTHASYLNENPSASSSNERLEFLGDAVLGLAVARLLYERFPTAGEGELTRIRAEIVRGSTLARAAGRLALGDFLILGRGEESAGGRTRDRNLAGALEAIIGAVYLDAGFAPARALVRRVLRPEIEQALREGVRVDAKSSLQHVVQARWHEPPEYVTVEDTAGAPDRRFVVEVRAAGRLLGRGEGRNKREAQQQAAREALAGLELSEKEGATCT
ncbi:ribonuclease III [Tepidiforma sp.]|uniref:ribonuclease III n=1 Tax=Tepidiforma sp. TaxID=2682230 RepID=UPI002ADD9EEB|nr:ribonuclease III [Tepidiforma sp.]